jgi:hypothetical protein
VNLHERLPQLLLLELIRERSARAEKRRSNSYSRDRVDEVCLLISNGRNGQRRLYRFVPYRYGPFAKQLYDDLQALAQNGVVRVENDHTEDKTGITLVDMAKANAMLGYGTVRDRLRGE